MSIRVTAVGRNDVPPCSMPDRFRRDVTYFMTPPGEQGVPKLPAGEYWIRRDDAARWLDALTFEVISPLDSQSKAQIELTEEQEAWLEWLLAHQVEHVRLE